MKEQENKIHGLIVIDKPQGVTSHDVVEAVRRRLHTKKVGHTGTLDPMATGVLVILLGHYTKLSNKFTNFDKEYFAELTLGSTTDTGDIEGKITKTFAEETYQRITRSDVEAVLAKFIGDGFQIPPMVSAIKINGKRLYKLARCGIEVPREPRKITINELELKGFVLPKISFRVACSKGTYVRKLCEDIGQALGTGAHQSILRRTRVGNFTIEKAVKLDLLNESHIRNIQIP